MCHASGSPVLELLQRLAEVLADRTVDEFELTARRKDRDQSWNAVHDQARLAFAFAQLVIGYGELECASRFIRCRLEWGVHITPPPGQGRSRRRESAIVQAQP